MLNNNCNAFQQSHCIWKDYLEITSRGSSLPNRINSYDECPGNPESLDFTTQGFSLFLSLPPAFSHSFLLSVSFLSPSLPLSFVVLFLGVYNDNNSPTVKKITPNLLKTEKNLTKTFTVFSSRKFFKASFSYWKPNCFLICFPIGIGETGCSHDRIHGHAVSSPTARWLCSSSHWEGNVFPYSVSLDLLYTVKHGQREVCPSQAWASGPSHIRLSSSDLYHCHTERPYGNILIVLADSRIDDQTVMNQLPK